jgi:hypothetical protein
MALDFGVEIEMLLPGSPSFSNRIAEGVARNISEAGAPCQYESYNHARRNHWKIVTDGSLSPPTGYVGLEAVSPPLNASGIPQIYSVCSALQQSHARVNRSCGLHVHIGAQHLTMDAMRRLAFLYIEHEDVIDDLMPPSRRKSANQYCRSLKIHANIEGIARARDVRALAYAIRQSSDERHQRYTKLNFTSYWKHGTVEFRQHAGTIDPEKIRCWVSFCSKLVEVSQIEQPIVPPVLNNQNPVLQRIARAKQLRLIYEAVARPEGATSVEVQAILGRRTPPALASDLNRIGVSYSTNGRRDGHVVYKLANSGAPTPTLASLLAKLSLGESDEEFWRNRLALLASATGVATHEDDTSVTTELRSIPLGSIPLGSRWSNS